jgi:hypothetical protein
LQIFIYFVLSNPNKKYCTTIDAKCPMFLQFSQQTLVFVLKVPETLYQPFAKLHSHIAPYQVLIFSFFPDHLLLVFWELILGYVTPLD